MPDQPSSVVFDEERAAAYDERFAKLAPIRAALHFLIQQICSDLPADARVLCVGAGTGAELIALALTFPQWRFMAVEPAGAMLAVCRGRAEESGVASRCAFHEGYLDTLPASDPFDAATCLLVSHFLMQSETRRGLFRQIASQLRPNGILVSADLASDTSTTTYQNLLDVWLRMMRRADVPAEEIEAMQTSFGRYVALLPPAEVASIIEASGFDAPVLFLQTLLIHAWYARRV